MSDETNPVGDPGAPAPTAPVAAAPNTATAAAPKKRSNPWLVTALLLIIAGTGVVIWQETRPKPRDEPVLRAYYTTDDGKTWFTDDAERLPPFDHDGRQAVRLHLFTCDEGKTRFVGYLEKLPEEAFTTLKAEGQDPAKMDDDDIAERFGWLAKRPGDAEWRNSNKEKEAYQAIVQARCPNGALAMPVFPRNTE